MDFQKPLPWEKEEIDSVYSCAYTFYQQGHYLEASEIFSYLVVLDSLDFKNWMGLGASFQMQKKYEKALEAYSAAAVLEKTETDPLPHIHAAECLHALEEKERALLALNSAEAIATNQPKYRKLIEQLSLIKQAWTA